MRKVAFFAKAPKIAWACWDSNPSSQPRRHNDYAISAAGFGIKVILKRIQHKTNCEVSDCVRVTQTVVLAGFCNRGNEP